jgi:hypothetical protein
MLALHPLVHECVKIERYATRSTRLGSTPLDEAQAYLIRPRCQIYKVQFVMLCGGLHLRTSRPPAFSQCDSYQMKLLPQFHLVPKAWGVQGETPPKNYTNSKLLIESDGIDTW